MSMQSREILLYAGAVGACLSIAAAVGTLIKANLQIIGLERELEDEKQKRIVERAGRIKTQQDKRACINETARENGFQLRPIGYIESPFPDRRGTPRQPSLVPAATGRIRFDKKIIQREHFSELEQFSHIWIIFIFHENTNADDTNAPPAKIKPPRLHGKKVGTLSTRSPHRPNPIGLSWCEVVSIGADYIEVRGIDLLHGTPVLDVKPYIPYDLVLSQIALPMAVDSTGIPLQSRSRELSVPSWIFEADIVMRNVCFAPSALDRLSELIDGDERERGFCNTAAQAKELIEQVLRQDVRGVHQGRGFHADIEENGKHTPSYMCRLDGLSIRFVTTERSIRVEEIIADG